jgi:hypothetical protein
LSVVSSCCVILFGLLSEGILILSERNDQSCLPYLGFAKIINYFHSAYKNLQLILRTDKKGMLYALTNKAIGAYRRGHAGGSQKKQTKGFAG